MSTGVMLTLGFRQILVIYEWGACEGYYEY